MRRALILAVLLSARPAAADILTMVTSLADSGKGTLRECVASPVPRTCQFSADLPAGVINLKSAIVVKSPDLVIDGESAPFLIDLRGAGVWIQASNVTLRHIAVRPGAGSRDSKRWDGVVVWSTGKKLTNVTLDHVSLTWAVDENLSSYGAGIDGVTVTDSIIAEALHCSVHDKGCHSMGVLWGPGTRNIVMARNLLAHNHDRNPRFQAGSTMSFVNNFVYGWGGSSGWNLLNMSATASSAATMLDFIGNVYKPSKASTTKYPPIYYDKKVPKGTKAYVEGNIAPVRPRAGMDEWLVSGLPKTMRSMKPLLPPVSAISAEDVPGWVEQNVGPQPQRRGPIEARIVAEAMNGTGTIKNAAPK